MSAVKQPTDVERERRIDHVIAELDNLGKEKPPKKEGFPIWLCNIIIVGGPLLLICLIFLTFKSGIEKPANEVITAARTDGARTWPAPTVVTPSIMSMQLSNILRDVATVHTIRSTLTLIRPANL